MPKNQCKHKVQERIGSNQHRLLVQCADCKKELMSVYTHQVDDRKANDVIESYHLKPPQGPFLAHPDLAVIFLVRDWGEVSSDPDERALSK